MTSISAGAPATVVYPHTMRMVMDDRDLLSYCPHELRAALANRTTWHRWRTGQSRIPRAVILLLQILIGGTLPFPEWEGWRWHAGALVDPAGVVHTPRTIEAWHWTRQELQALRARENVHELAGDNIVVLDRTLARRITASMRQQLKNKGELK